MRTLELKNNEIILINNRKYIVGECLFDHDIILTCLDNDFNKKENTLEYIDEDKN